MNRNEKQTAVNRVLADKYGLDPKVHFWKQKQSGLWIATHDAVMIIAEQEGITFSEPKVNWDTLPNICICVTAHQTATGKEVWTFGECSADNNRNSYPWAMAEKRAKDRAVLMLIDAYQYGVKSEEEAEDFKRPPSEDDFSYVQETEKELNGGKLADEEIPPPRKPYNLKATAKQEELVTRILTDDPVLFTSEERAIWEERFATVLNSRKSYSEMIEDLKGDQGFKRTELRGFIDQFNTAKKTFKDKGIGNEYNNVLTRCFADEIAIEGMSMDTGVIVGRFFSEVNKVRLNTVLKTLRTVYAENTSTTAKVISPPTPPGDLIPVKTETEEPELFPRS